MALTPRSFFRSPTLLVAAIFSVAIAMLGATVFLAAFFCNEAPSKASCKMKKRNLDQLAEFRQSSCGHLLDDAFAHPSAWTHDEFVNLAVCLQRADDSERSVSASVLGLRHFPNSEALHNLRGIGLIDQQKWDEAVHALRAGLRAVGNPTTGTMENNLAWAGLYASDTMTLSEARRHYQDSLNVDSGSCEAIHTGMWTEYAIASRSTGSSRDAAIAAYQTLRQKYAPCVSRARHGDLITKYEVAGAGILDTEITKLSMVQMFERFHEIDEDRINWKDFDTSLVRRSLSDVEIRGHEVDEACEAIAPVRSARPQCRKALQTVIR